MVMITRRRVLTGILAAPIVVRSGLCMPVSGRFAIARFDYVNIETVWRLRLEDGLWDCRVASEDGTIWRNDAVPCPFAVLDGGELPNEASSTPTWP